MLLITRNVKLHAIVVPVIHGIGIHAAPISRLPFSHATISLATMTLAIHVVELFKHACNSILSFGTLLAVGRLDSGHGLHHVGLTLALAFRPADAQPIAANLEQDAHGSHR